MSYTINKGEIIIEGWEKGIAVSPHKGIANIQAGNISTETDEVVTSFNRVQQSQVNTTQTGTLTFVDTSHLGSSISLSKGVWINISASSHPAELPTGNYYVMISSGGGFILANHYYDISGISGYTAGLTATFTLIRNMSKPISHATENYFVGTAPQYRYYVLDDQGLVWVYDTANDFTQTGIWMLPSFGLLSGANSIQVLNGWLFIFCYTTIYVRSTSTLGATSNAAGTFSAGVVVNNFAFHNAFVGHQNTLYYTDGNLIGSIFPNSSIVPTATNENVQSYCSYTAVTTTGTISSVIGGTLPLSADSTKRIPAFFFTSEGGTQPTNLAVGTVYWIAYSTGFANFQVFAASTGGAAIDIASGATGIQYFNTFFPMSAGGNGAMVFTPERVTLPFFERAQTIGEVSNNVIIGCSGNTLYSWNQIDPKPGDFIPLPEINVVQMINVNNMAYVFAGNKGNIYVTNGSTASLVLTVPDYCAGISGTASSYIEPYFTWGDAMYCRGRVYFSILDQTLQTSSFQAKAGNCGGVWSFVPTQNFFVGQDTGLSLRIENQNSYGTYNGYATVLIPSQTQTSRSPQYWSAWQSSLTSPLYGIDGTDTTANTPCVIETDIVPTGTMLDKKTFSQIEYKLAAPLTSSETVSIKYRQNSTDAFVSCGTAVVESTTGLSGYFSIVFEKGQWLQLQITLTPNGAVGAASFVRLRQIIIR